MTVYPRFRAALTALVVAVLLAAGCSPPSGSATAVALELRPVPDPPKVGTARLEISARDAAGTPMIGGTLRVEGNMSHAGMRPTFADCEETRPGSYACDLEFTMGGDWFVQVDAAFPDGTKARQTFDVKGVEQP